MSLFRTQKCLMSAFRISYFPTNVRNLRPLTLPPLNPSFTATKSEFYRH